MTIKINKSYSVRINLHYYIKIDWRAVIAFVIFTGDYYIYCYATAGPSLYLVIMAFYPLTNDEERGPIWNVKQSSAGNGWII